MKINTLREQEYWRLGSSKGAGGSGKQAMCTLPLAVWDCKHEGFCKETVICLG